MHLSTFGVNFLLCAITLVNGAAIPPVEDAKCVRGLYIISTRETGAPPGEGLNKAVSSAIKKRIQNSVSVALDYPANLNYIESVAAGGRNLTRLIEEHVNACPQAKIVLLGYSQGAQVVGDVLCGTTEAGFKPSPPIGDEFGDRIVAAISMGDPAHVAKLPYNAGTSVKDGLFPRLHNEKCKKYDSIRRSYCDTGDLYCDRGNNRTVHGLYATKYLQDAVDFVVSKAN